MFGKRKIAWMSLVLLVLIIKIFSMFPAAVERYYSTGVYPLIARLERLLFGWVPFSVGDVLYSLAVIWLIYGLVALIRRMVQRRAGWSYFAGLLRRTVFGVLLVYVIFNLSWGLNYDRLGIADQLQLNVKPYTTGELNALLARVTDKLNSVDSLSRLRREELNRHRTLFDSAAGAYHSLGDHDPRFVYPSPSVKNSFFGYLGDYLGFSGYYNPFTGEAQVNTTVPVFTQPYTTCHEIGHQLGYARENEANFAGYLSARSSADPAFQYSVYFDLYIYAARELYMRDSSLLQPFRAKLRPDIRKDFREWREFSRKFENPFEPVVRRMYGSYLRANRQPQGMKTYSEVTAWLIAYVRKNGWGAF